MLTAIQFQSNKKLVSNLITVALPAKDRGSITVICGRNHSGKSYLLRRIQRTIVSRNDALGKKASSALAKYSTDDIICSFTPEDEPLTTVSISTIGNISKLTRGTSMSQKSNHKRRKHFLHKAENFDQIQIKESLEVFGVECLQAYFKKQNGRFSIKQWNDPENVSYRKEILESLVVPSIFVAVRDNEFVETFERLTSGRLYFGVNLPENNLPILEYYIVFSRDIVIPLGSWSEGQRVLFSLLLLLHYKRPQVLLFDEIENHLHPEFISVVLDYIRQRIPQTIIATHHPHIIFSRYVDSVHYLEMEKPSVEVEDVLEYNGQRSKSPVRKVEVLDRTYAKLISSYKLFDSYDNLLLRLSSSNLENLNEVLVNTFTSLFFYEVVSPNFTKVPDLQSQKLYELFASAMKLKKIKVVEIGAGDGRLLIDINKIVNSAEKEKIEWCLYEPKAEHRNKIKKTLADFAYKDLISVTGTLPKGKFDFIILANVLHELTPPGIAEILQFCQTNLDTEGKALIIELYPLLKPEKYAVPLRSKEWVKLSRKLGFNAVAEGIAIRNASTEAYFVQLATRSDQKISKKEMEALIGDYWQTEIAEDRTGNYAGQINLDRSEQIPGIIGNLTTIASTMAYAHRYWK